MHVCGGESGRRKMEARCVLQRVLTQVCALMHACALEAPPDASPSIEPARLVAPARCLCEIAPCLHAARIRAMAEGDRSVSAPRRGRHRTNSAACFTAFAPCLRLLAAASRSWLLRVISGARHVAGDGVGKSCACERRGGVCLQGRPLPPQHLRAATCHAPRCTGGANESGGCGHGRRQGICVVDAAAAACAFCSRAAVSRVRRSS